MIDFLSTRESTREEDAFHARLIAAIISQAVLDASMRISPKEARLRQNLVQDPDEGLSTHEAVEFLFGDSTVFPLYASLIGSSAESIRAALLRIRDDITESGFSKNILFTSEQRRMIRGRHQFWKEHMARKNAQ